MLFFVFIASVVQQVHVSKEDFLFMQIVKDLNKKFSFQQTNTKLFKGRQAKMTNSFSFSYQRLFTPMN